MQFDTRLPSGWRWETIESVQAAEPRPVVTGPFGSAIGSKFFVDEGVPVIRGNNLTLDRRKFIDDGFVFLTEEKATEFRNLEAHPGDLVFTAAGTIGQVGLIPKQPRFPRYIISNKQMRARLNTSVVEPLFAYYWFTEPYVRDYICSRNTGSTIPLINLSVLRVLPLPVPPLDVQRAILGVVATLDDRIDLLRQTNSTLESIAQALFKSWFIAFDPVRAKQAGREPEDMDAATAALFPAEFEESALGLIPKGWGVGTVEDLFVLQRGFDLPARERTDGPFTVFAASGPHGTHSTPMAQGPGVVTGRSGVIGRVFYAYEDYWPLNTALWVKQFKTATPPYAFQVLQTMDLARLNAGSAVPTLNRNHVHAQPAVIPPVGLIGAYTAVAVPLLERIRSNSEHVGSLEALRDTLLPRLISGKLRLPEAQEKLEDVFA